MMKLNTIILILSLFACTESEKNTFDVNENPSELEIFGEGIISTDLYERDIAISHDRKDIIYTLADYKQRIRCLVSVSFTNGAWTEPQKLNISGKYSDIEPFFTNDGNRLYFASNRPLYDSLESKDYNIWYSDRQGEEWSKPIALANIINSENDEFYPSISENGNLYFTSAKENGIGREDIYLTQYIEGNFQKPEVLDTNINTQYYEFNSYISPDENILIFSSYGREDDLGGGDLYYSKKDSSGNWEKAKNMGPIINSNKLDYCPFIDVKRNNFYFTSERTKNLAMPIKNVIDLIDYASKPQNGFGDIYRISLDKLELK